MNPTTGCRLTEGNLGTEERCAPQLAGESEDQIVRRIEATIRSGSAQASQRRCSTSQ
jgi:hypothetical protein